MKKHTTQEQSDKLDASLRQRFASIDDGFDALTYEIRQIKPDLAKAVIGVAYKSVAIIATIVGLFIAF